MNLETLAIFALLITPPSGVLCAQTIATDTAKIEWAKYEGVSLRFEHPKDWKVSFSVNPKHGNQDWLIVPPTKDNHLPMGYIDIIEQTNGWEKRPLDKIVAGYTEGMGKLHGEVQRIKPRGGECLAFLWQVPGVMLSLRGLVASAECYNKKSRHFTARCNVTGEYKLDEEGRRHQFIFQHLLDTLQFK